MCFGLSLTNSLTQALIWRIVTTCSLWGFILGSFCLAPMDVIWKAHAISLGLSCSATIAGHKHPKARRMRATMAGHRHPKARRMHTQFAGHKCVQGKARVWEMQFRFQPLSQKAEENPDTNGSTGFPLKRWDDQKFWKVKFSAPPWSEIFELRPRVKFTTGHLTIKASGSALAPLGPARLLRLLRRRRPRLLGHRSHDRATGS